MLHGFTQTGRLWGRFGETLEGHRTLVSVDLPGHAGSDEVRADLPTTAALVAETVRDELGGGRCDLLGYSLGARVALHVVSDDDLAVENLAVDRLVVIGATAGMESPELRERRRRSDGELADRLEASGDVAGFIRDWLSGPMFSGLPEGAAAEEERLRNTARGLASSLRSCGAGNQEPLWDRMARLPGRCSPSRGWTTPAMPRTPSDWPGSPRTPSHRWCPVGGMRCISPNPTPLPGWSCTGSGTRRRCPEPGPDLTGASRR